MNISLITILISTYILGEINTNLLLFFNMENNDISLNPNFQNFLEDYLQENSNKVKIPAKYDAKKNAVVYAISVIIAVFIVELISLSIFQLLNFKSRETVAILEALILILVMLPIFYFGIFKNYKKQLEIRQNLIEGLESAEVNFLTLLQSSPDSVIISRKDDKKIIFANKTAINVFGYSLEEFMGKTQLSINLYKNPLQRTALFKKLAKNKQVNSFEVDFITKDGSTLCFILNVSEIRIKEISYLIFSGKDITERQAMMKDLLEAKDKAEESNQLKTEFLNNMSHEIRTPLNGIMGFSEFLTDPELSQSKREQFVNIIQQSGNQLMHIIDDILEISMLGTKKVTVNESVLSINDLLMELYQVFSIKAKEKELPFYLKKGLLDKNSMVLTDRDKVNKIVSNLLENALKFTQEGFIELGYNITKKDKKAPMIEIYVKDTGIGIAKEKQDAIFERFAQAEKELSKKVGGLGLGLSIAKENIELMGGTITVTSKPEQGTTFIVCIPYKPIESEITLEEENTIARTDDDCTILIAEDEEFNYMYLETLLQDILKLDCNLIHAKNGQEAIELTKSNPSIFMILMDLKMPILSGFEVAKKIKETHPQIPIIAQTSYSTNKDKDRALRAGCDEFISKPINTEVLKNVLSKYIKT